MTYFAKPNFIIYDEWFDEDLKKKKIDFQIKNQKNILNVHEFFYNQSNYLVGASENNMQFDIQINNKELIINNCLDKVYKSYPTLIFRKSKFIESITKYKLAKKLIYFLSIFGLVSIFGYAIFFISQSKKNELNISTDFYSQEQEF